MQDLFQEFIDCLRGMNNLSRHIFKFGLPVVTAMYASALFCRLAAGRLGPYYALRTLCLDFLESAKELLGAVCVCALTLQILFLAEKIDRN